MHYMANFHDDILAKLQAGILACRQTFSMVLSLHDKFGYPIIQCNCCHQSKGVTDRTTDRGMDRPSYRDAVASKNTKKHTFK